MSETVPEHVVDQITGEAFEVLHRDVTVKCWLFPLIEGDRLVVFRSADGRLHACEAGEFDGGRYQPLRPAPAASFEIRLPCPTCNGDTFVTDGDRHTETAKDVCPTCRGRRTIPAGTGLTPEASAPGDTVEF